MVIEIIKSYVKVFPNRLGEIKEMNCGYTAEIIEYNNSDDITIKFLDTDETIKTTYGNFKKGNIKSHFSPTVYGWGIIGLENIQDENGKMLKSYRVWSSMIGRCYGEVYHKNKPNYIGCEICEEWKYYSNFKKWFNENWYEIDEELQLDKDLICNNLGLEKKIYSPSTCLFLPKSLNTSLTNLNQKRKFSVLPSGKYRIQVKNKGFKQTYNTYEEALKGCIEDRILYIRNKLKSYENKIPKYIYEQVYNVKIK